MTDISPISACVDIAQDLAVAMPADSACAAFALALAQIDLTPPGTIRAASAAIDALNQWHAARMTRMVLIAGYAAALVEREFTDRPTAVAARAAFMTATAADVEAASLAADGTAFDTLNDLRGQMARYFSTLTPNLAPVAVISAPSVRPALVWAHTLYNDPTRASEIVARNRLPHPGYVPARFEALAS